MYFGRKVEEDSAEGEVSGECMTRASDREQKESVGWDGWMDDGGKERWKRSE